MPEGLEAEIWRRSAGVLVGRSIAELWCDPRVAPEGLADLLVGRSIEAVRRRGKILVVDTDGPSLGLHFGMTGRLEVDGGAPIERLEYSSSADRVEWDRLRLWTTPAESNRRRPRSQASSSDASAPALRLNDPRRLGRLSLDPDVDALGHDLLTLTADQLRHGLGSRRLAVKGALLDQRVVAGLGNLCADEVLFHAGVAPSRPVDSLSEDEIEAISSACRRQLPQMLAAGGSTTGELSPEIRAAPGVCPNDGASLRRDTIGGRTAVWCPTHQH